MDFPANLSINADDFGLHPRVSLAIGQCAEEGLIHSFSALPFADGFHAGLLRDILRRRPDIKIGAHLSLLDPEAGLPERPGHHRDFLARYLTGRVRPRQVRDRWEAHLRSLASYLDGGAIAHLDGHQHLHVLPGLWQAAQSLQKQFGIPRLRVPYESLRRAVTCRFPAALALQALARLRLRPGDARLLGFFTSTCFTVEANRKGLEAVLRHPDRRFELMVHPALPPEAGRPRAEDSVAASQVQEIAELRKLRDFFRAAQATVSA